MKADLFENQLTGNVRDFARQIWLAGLGAFARTQQEGGRLFEALVQEGQAVDVRMKKVTEQKTGPVEDGIDTVKGTVEELRGRAAGTWNKLEEVFQGRVARALRRLGVPGQDDIQPLFRQVELLDRNIQDLTRAAEAEARDRRTHTDRSGKSADPVALSRIADPVA